MKDRFAIHKYRHEMSRKANDLLDRIVASVSPTPKWAYCAGGELDTQMVPFDLPDATNYYVPVERSIQNLYTSEPPQTSNAPFCVCDVKKVARFITHTIKDDIWCYDISFSDTAVVLICDRLRAPREVPHIYEMCWYGREISHINQYLKPGVDAANIPQKDSK